MPTKTKPATKSPVDPIVQSVFADHYGSVWTTYDVTILVDTLMGGTPFTKEAVEGWIKKNLGATNSDLIAEMVAKTMVETGQDMDSAVDETIRKRGLSGFKRDEVTAELFLDGRCAKAMLKEAANCAWPWPSRKWGPSRKATASYWAEHVYVPDKRLYLGVKDPDTVNTSFPHTRFGNGIAHNEMVFNASLTFSVQTDTPEEISADDWAQTWVRAESGGIGAGRSQGYGRFVVTSWKQRSKKTTYSK